MLSRPSNLMRLLGSQHEEMMTVHKAAREEARVAHEEAMAAHKETMSSLEEMGEENKRRHEEWKADLARRDEEMREFNREILLRNEKVYTAVLAELEEGRKQLRANTEAVLSVLDRLDRRDAA